LKDADGDAEQQTIGDHEQAEALIAMDVHESSSTDRMVRSTTSTGEDIKDLATALSMCGVDNLDTDPTKRGTYMLTVKAVNEGEELHKAIQTIILGASWVPNHGVLVELGCRQGFSRDGLPQSEQNKKLAPFTCKGKWQKK